MKKEKKYSKFRYDEMKAFCRQYPEKKQKANQMIHSGSMNLSGMPKDNQIHDTVLMAVERREKLIADCDLIDACAKAVGNGLYYQALIAHVCYGKAYEHLFDILPTFHRNSFFDVKEEFFDLLNKKWSHYTF